MALFRPGTATGTSSFAETASYALTASFVTASNVWGPFGSSSIESASYALTASYALNAGTPGGSNTQIQFNSASAFSGSTNFTFDYASNVVYLTGSLLTSGSIILTGSMNVSGAISSSNGPETVGFYGTASWAISASYADEAGSLTPGAAVPAAPPEYAVQFNSGSYLSGSSHLLYKYPQHDFEQGLYVTASAGWSHAQGRSTLATASFSHAEGMADAQFETQTSIIFSGILNAAVQVGDTTIKIKQNPGNIAGGTIRVYNNTGGYDDYTVLSGATYNAGTGTYDVIITTPAVAKASGGNTVQVVSTTSTWVQNYNIAYAQGSHVEGYRTYTLLSQSHAEGSGSVTGKIGSAPISGLYDSDFDGYSDFQIILGPGPNPSNYFLPGKSLFYDDTPYGPTNGVRVLTVRSATVSSFGIASWLISVSIQESINYYSFWLLGIPGLPLSLTDTYYFKPTFIINKGKYSHAEGSNTSAMGAASHAEGLNTDTFGIGSHAEGELTLAIGTGSHTEGYKTKTLGNYSHAEGEETKAEGLGSHAEGYYTYATGSYSHAEGYFTTSSGTYSHAEGFQTKALGPSSHAEGFQTVALGNYSHAEGYQPVVSGNFAHGEGFQTIAGGNYSHAEGYQVTATGSYAHAEGQQTAALGNASHAEGYQAIAFGFASHAGGLHTIASASYATTIGRYNLHNNTTALFTIGDGASDANRHDLLNASIGIISISGSATVSSSLNVIGISDVTGSNNITGSWTLTGTGQATGSLDITGSYSLQGIGIVTGSFLITGSLVANYANLTGSLTGSFFGTGSGDFDGQFIGRVTGSMTGSFIGTGSGNFDGRFIGQLTGSATGSFTGTGSGNFDGRFIGSVTGSTTGSFIGTGSGFFDGLFTGSNANGVSFYGTSSWAVTASYVTGSIFNNTNPVLSASYAESSSYALSASYSVTSSYAESASYALSSSYSVTSSYAESASYALSASYSVTSSYAESASYALSASYSVTSSYAESASYALSSSYSVTSSYAESSSYALSASYSVTASHAINALVTASVSLNDITFYKGDGTQFIITVDTGSGGSGPAGDFVASNWTGSTTSYFAGTASYATQSLSSSFAETASAVNVTLSSNVDERLPIILAYTSSNSGAKLAYIDAGFDYNTSTNALYLPSNGALILGNTTLQSSVVTFGSATAQNHVVRITGSLNVSKSVNVEGAVTAGFGANTVGFVGTASWAVSASHVSGAFMQNGNSFGTTAFLGTNDVQDLVLETNGSQRIFISSSGQTWLGSAPSQQFGGTTAPIQLYAGTGTSNGVGIRGQVIYFYPAGAQTTASLQYGSAGLAAWQLRNLGTQAFQIRSTPGGSSSTTLMHFASGSSGQERVGIMTETPQHTFDVSGSARITGSFYLPGVTSSPYNNVLIIDTGSGQVYVTASSAIGGGGVPGGALRSIQFNSESIFSGSSNFTFNDATNQLDLTGSMVISGGLRTISTGPTSCYLDTNNGSLHAPNGNVIFDWFNTLLNDYQGDTVLNIGARTLVWNNGSTAINFGTDNEVVVNGDVYLDDLTAATPAVDADDVVLINSITGQLYYTASTAFGGGGGPTTPGGPLRSIQFNSASVFSGSSNFTFNEVNNTVTLTGSFLVTQSYISTIDYVDYRVIQTSPTHVEGRTHWLDDTKTLQIDTDVNNFSIEVGHQNVVRARNTTGFNLAAGKVVYINGESGNRPTITTASWDGDPTSASTLGFVAQQINDNQTGYVVTNGMLRGIDTNAFAPGTQLYLSSSGNYTSTIPISPKHEVRLGKTITQATDGVIYVDVMNGYELGELHDVLFNSSTNGDLVVKSGSLWINSKQLTGSYGLTGSLTAIDGGLTGSLLGTASYVTGSIFSGTNPALSASYALTYPYNSTSSIIGDDVNSSYNINHGFNTRNLHITVYENFGNYETVYPDIRRPHPDTASVVFANPVSSTNQYVVYVSQ